MTQGNGDLDDTHTATEEATAAEFARTRHIASVVQEQLGITTAADLETWLQGIQRRLADQREGEVF